LNLIYAELDTTDGSHIRSSSIQVNYVAPDSPGPSGAGGLQQALRTLITLPVAAVLLTLQALQDLLSEVAAAPPLIALILAFAIVSSTLSKGLLGLELLLLAP